MKTNRLLLILICLCAVLLTACGGGEIGPTATPTAEAPANTPDPSAETAVVSPFGTLPPSPSAPPDQGPQPEITGVDEQPRPGGAGTLVAVGTVDPELPSGFDRIILVRMGGPADENGQPGRETIILERSGAISRNGVSGSIPTRTVAEIGAMIDAINIFAIQANFTGSVPLEGPAPYIYQMQVEVGFSERLLTAQEGLMPEALEAIVAAVMSEGLKIENP
jgi:hypothetical protein